MFDLYHGDCLDVLPTLADKRVGAIIADPPYGNGKTDAEWDEIIPLDAMWDQLKRVVEPNRAIVLFSSQPFTSALVVSNLATFKYEWVWHKSHAANFMNAKYRPLSKHENILVFGSGVLLYNPQKTIGPTVRKRSGKSETRRKKGEAYRSAPTNLSAVKSNEYYPATVQFFNGDAMRKRVHPTQKPVALLEYLIKTYTDEGDTVLDFTMGSGTTGVACVNTGRDFIGIELEEKYFNIAEQRIAEAQPSLLSASDV